MEKARIAMRMTISKVQKGCMFVGAALFGSLCVAGVMLERLSTLAPLSHEVTFYACGSFALLCYLFWVMVFGAWLGGAVCGVWRSPLGKAWFWTLSGGTLGGILSSAGAAHWMIPEGGVTSRAPAPIEMLVLGCAIFTGTMLGLAAGFFIGRRLQRKAEIIDIV